MGKHRHEHWNPKAAAIAAAVPFPGALEDSATPNRLGLANKLILLRVAVLAGGFHFILRLLLLLKALNY
jgi:hypothetical protein